MQYTCPTCGQVGAQRAELPPPKCHRCNFTVEMLPSRNGKILDKDAPLVILAAVERGTPGKLASWLRTVERWKPMLEPTNNVYFIGVVKLK